jgi:hypothetical protein
MYSDDTDRQDKQYWIYNTDRQAAHTQYRFSNTGSTQAVLGLNRQAVQAGSISSIGSTIQTDRQHTSSIDLQYKRQAAHNQYWTYSTDIQAVHKQYWVYNTKRAAKAALGFQYK